MSRFGFVGDGYRDCGLREVGSTQVSIRPDRSKDRTATAEITVDYSSDFTAEAKNAFERAVQVWENHIASPVQIRIDANRLEDPQPGVLGAAGPASFWFVGSGQNQIIAGAPLADALVGNDLEPDSADVEAFFNLDRDWHYGEGDAPPGVSDFTTVVLHEIGHGLNFLSLCQVTGGEAQCRFENNNGNLVPGVFTTFLAERSNGSLTKLTNESAYPDASSLYQALTGDQLFYVGKNAELAAGRGEGPVPPKMYAPSSYQRGSSVSHNDEETYPTGSVNALMTPNLAGGETLRLPGPLVCGHLIDLGWPVGPGCSLNSVDVRNPVASTEGVSSENEGTATLKWRQVGNGKVKTYVIEQQYFNNKFQKRDSISSRGPGEYSYTVEGLKVGKHRFRISYVDENGNLVRGGTVTDPISIKAKSSEVTVYPNPFKDVARISFVLEEKQRVQVKVFDTLGRHVSTLLNESRPPNDARPVVFNPSQLPRASGVYFIRVEAETFTKTVKAVRVQ